MARTTATTDAPGTHRLAPSRRLDGVRSLFGSDDFRNYWFASAVFGLGIWAYITAMGWTALELTDSAFAVSMANVVYFLPMFLLALPAGVVADRWDRRWTAILARGGSGVAMGAMVLMTANDALTYAWLLVFSAGVGLSVILELASRQAYVAQIVAPEALVNATALTAVQGGIARVVGPLLAGWMLDVVGASGGYAVFAVSNGLFVWFFWRIRMPGGVVTDGETRDQPGSDLLEGFRYLARHRDARSIVLISILAGVVGWVYLALMPVMARDVLGGDAVTLGALGMAVGLGSVPGSIMLSVVRNFTAEGRTFVGAVALWGTGVVVFALSRWFPLSLLALAVAGLGFGVQVILVRTILLRIVDRAYHGRVLGALMLTWGANVAGTLAAGALTEVVGPSVVVGLSGALIVLIVVTIAASNPRVLRL